MMAQFVVGVALADIRRDPDAEAELVTQALMNVSARAGEVVGEWTYVTLPDYAGWIRTGELEEPITRGYCEGVGTCGVALPYSLVVTELRTPLYRDEEGEGTMGEVYLSTVLPYIDLAHPRRLRVALPGEREGWLARDAVAVRSNDELFPWQERSVVTAYARSFLGVPYLWGGTSCVGVDCSGLVQLCQRMGGAIIPRDADQQHDFLTQGVEREEMQAGDLIFFGRERITHVVLALNGHEYIHAEGLDYERVVLHSLDSGHSAYHATLAERVWAIKRVTPHG